MNSLDSSLTQRQGVVLAGRVLCVFFLFWTVINLSYLPGDIAGLLHFVPQSQGVLVASSYNFWAKHYVEILSAAVLRAAVELWVAGLFYRCSPKIAAFLLPLDVETGASLADEA